MKYHKYFIEQIGNAVKRSNGFKRIVNSKPYVWFYILRMDLSFLEGKDYFTVSEIVYDSINIFSLGSSSREICSKSFDDIQDLTSALILMEERKEYFRAFGIRKFTHRIEDQKNRVSMKSKKVKKK